MVTVRFFAAAREAAGVASIEVEPGPIGTRLAEQSFGQRFDKVLAMSTLLCDGRRLTGQDTAGDGAVVDVLPPFAGG